MSSGSEGPSPPKKQRVQHPLAKRYIRHIDGGISFNRKFKMLNAKSTFVIENLPQNPESLLHHIFEQCVKDATAEARRNEVNAGRLGASISSELLNPDVWIPIRPLTRNTTDTILNRLLEVAQSKSRDGSLWGAPFNVAITIIDHPMLQHQQQVRGSGVVRRTPKNVRHMVRPNALLPVRNEHNGDTYCLFYALEISRIYHSKLKSPQNFAYYLNRNLVQQWRDAVALMNAVGIPQYQADYDAAVCVPPVVDYWNERYGNNSDGAGGEPLRFKVFIFGEFGQYKPEFQYGPDDYTVPIPLYHHGGHFDGVRWGVGNAIFGRDYYCFACECPYDNPDTHTSKCKARCLQCGRIGPGHPCKPVGCFVNECTSCGKTFDNENCYQYHLQSRWCAKSKQCEKCGVTWNVEQNTRNGRAGHDCKDKFCHVCRTWHEPKRGCFVQQISQQEQQEKREKQQYRLVAFDCETTQCEHVGLNKRMHNVNFISAWVACTSCIRNGSWRSPLRNQPPCKICGSERTVTFSHRDFTGTQVDGRRITENPMHDFINWLMANFDNRFPTVVFSHFGSRFDNIMAFKQFYENRICPRMITRGNRLYEMRVPRTPANPELIFRDSWNLMPVPLGSLPKAFGLAGVQDKPFFPHLYNRPENYDRVLNTLPPKSDYIYGGMRSDRQRTFDAWYAQNREEPFDLCEQLAAYCLNDTHILIEALIAFRTEFLEISGTTAEGEQQTEAEMDHNYCDCAAEKKMGGIDITWEPLTIASAAMRHFRLNHLKRDQVAIVPERGYDTADNQSTLALKFLDWYAQRYGVQVQTAHSPGGEQRIGRYTVDGYIAETDTVIEVNGCYFHACTQPHHRFRPQTMINGRTAAQVRKDDAARLAYIRSQVRGGVRVFRECEIHEMLRCDPQMRRSFNEYHDRGPVRLRDCFHGGRVGPTRLHYEVPEGWKMKLFDVRSLYPYTTATTAYPVGHPTRTNVMQGAAQTEVNWTRPEHIPVKGILKVFVVPPRSIDVPVLPAKFDNDERLLFPLCRSCTLQYPRGGHSLNYRCRHSDAQRGWVTTVTHIELAEALKSGYRCTRYYRSVEWEGEDKWDDKLFAGYVAEFMAMKYHASGFPSEIAGADEAVQDRFIAECAERFGIRIDRSKMTADKAKLIISKLLNNSLWGRFALKNGLSKTVVTESPAELRALLDDPRIEVNAVEELTPECLMVIYTPLKEFVDEHSTSNIVTALWTTSAARIHLLRLMQAVVRAPNCILLYTDTDSILFAYKESDGLPPGVCTGPHLGDLSDEWPDHELLEFVSGGCKQYALRMRNKYTDEEETMLKVRGITLNADACELLHFETFKRSVLFYASGGEAQEREEVEEIFIEYPNFIRPNLRTGNVYAVKLTKLYRPIVTKAIVGPNTMLIEFGSQ